MDDEKEIILIALSTSLEVYKNMLEDTQNMPNAEDFDNNGKSILEYTIKRHEELLIKYVGLINDSPENNLIGRPKW